MAGQCGPLRGVGVDGVVDNILLWWGRTFNYTRARCRGYKQQPGIKQRKHVVGPNPESDVAI
jgi:hypothetical protein